MSSRVASRVVSSMDSSVDSSVSTRRARMLCQSSGKSVESRQMRLREDASADGPHQCCSEQGEYRCRQRQLHHAVDTNHTVEEWKTTNSYNGCHQGKTSRIVAIGDCDLRIKAWGSKRDSAGSTCGCKT